MKIRTLFRGDTQRAIQKLMNADHPPAIRFKLKKLQKEINKTIELFQDTVRDIGEKYSKKDEQGKPITEATEQGRNFVFLSSEAESAYHADIVCLEREEFQIPIKLKAKDLEAAKLTAADEALLDEWIEDEEPA